MRGARGRDKAAARQGEAEGLLRGFVGEVPLLRLEQPGDDGVARVQEVGLGVWGRRGGTCRVSVGRRFNGPHWRGLRAAPRALQALSEIMG